MDHHVKHAAPDHPILPLIAERWSPYVFDPRPVEPDKLRSCLEAARWSASSYNEQPWSFLVARREDEGAFKTMLDCLVEANQAWAVNAGVLLITVVCRQFTRNGKPNRVADHDIGLAAGNLTLQAGALGLMVHQMAGVNLARVRQTYAIPETHEALTAIALGYAGTPDQEPADGLGDRDRTPRQRKPLSEIVFADRFGQSARLA